RATVLGQSLEDFTEQGRFPDPSLAEDHDAIRPATLTHEGLYSVDLLLAAVKTFPRGDYLTSSARPGRQNFTVRQRVHAAAGAGQRPFSPLLNVLATACLANQSIGHLDV